MFKLALQTYGCIVSGYTRLVAKENVFNDWGMCTKSIWRLADPNKDAPYNVYFEFHNGKHIPLAVGLNHPYSLLSLRGFVLSIFNNHLSKARDEGFNFMTNYKRVNQCSGYVCAQSCLDGPGMCVARTPFYKENLFYHP